MNNLNESDYREAFFMYCIERGLEMPTASNCGPLYCSGYVRAKFAPKAEYFTQVRQISNSMFYVCLAGQHYNDQQKTGGLFKLPEQIQNPES